MKVKVFDFVHQEDLRFAHNFDNIDTIWIGSDYY